MASCTCDDRDDEAAAELLGPGLHPIQCRDCGANYELFIAECPHCAADIIREGSVDTCQDCGRPLSRDLPDED